MAIWDKSKWNEKLIGAANINDLAGVKKALANGADINAKDNDGWTALYRASRNGYTKIVKFLLQQDGIEINAKNKHGDTALHYASFDNRIEIVKALLQKEGIEINAKNNKSKTALDLAKEYEYTEIAEIIEAKITEQERQREAEARSVLEQKQAAERKTMVERFTGKDGKGKGPRGI